MMIGSISNSYVNPYSSYGASPVQTTGSLFRQGQGSDGSVTAKADADGSVTAKAGIDGSVRIKNSADPDQQVKRGYKSSPAECKTCKERKYKDGSDENDVSFKTPGHISPQASAATVSAHEHEHVANAYEKAAKAGGKVLSCSVSLHTAICPECGTSYVSGGLTSTAISYPNESNPYQQDKKAKDALKLVGANIDYAA